MASSQTRGVSFIDIRRDKSTKSLTEIVRSSLNPENGEKRSIPTLVLYDEEGLQLFEKITYLDEYYLTNAEIETLRTHSDQIAKCVPENTRLIELGSGNLRKVNILLEAFERARKRVDYFALDLSLSELERTFAELNLDNYKYVQFNALHGTYDDGLAWVRESANTEKQTCIMTLGSSLGNFTRAAAESFLHDFTKALKSMDLMLVGLDACQDSARVHVAYNDSNHVTEAFYRNGLDHVNRLFGEEIFDQNQWHVDGHYDEEIQGHTAAYVALGDIDRGGFQFHKGERIYLELALKYSQEQANKLWSGAGLVPQASYANVRHDYYIHLLSPATMEFSSKAQHYAASPTPAIDDWHQLWTAWDVVTKLMVPRDDLLNIHFVKATSESPTQPVFYSTIFERGIDPDVENPELCHAHSEIPETWPPLHEILDYQLKVRARITENIKSGAVNTNRKLARGLWLAYEHEAMHLETFLYMLLQSQRVLPPPVQTPNFEALAVQAKKDRVNAEWHHVPETTINVGLNDPENDDGPDRYFGWDNERPQRTVTVKALEAQNRPISNGDYIRFLEATKYEFLPASWTGNSPATKINGAKDADHVSSHVDASTTTTADLVSNKYIRTVYGPIPLRQALDWPVMASYDDLAAYARWANGRIPTQEELQSIYSYVRSSSKPIAEKVSSSLISAVNGHLLNEGVHATPPATNGHAFGSANGHVEPRPNDSKLSATDLFIDLDGTHNVGFKNWHPTPVTGDTRLRGQSDVGGLWEWTSSPLADFEGFKSMDLYPGYTADFFDGKHNICLGGSWATVPRIAGRRSFVNWYQRNYPFVWCTARLVRDV